MASNSSANAITVDGGHGADVAQPSNNNVNTDLPPPLVSVSDGEESDSMMPELQDVSDSSEDEFSDDDIGTAHLDSGDEEPPALRPGRVRTRVEEDDDIERDRRHPSQRVDSNNNSNATAPPTIVPPFIPTPGFGAGTRLGQRQGPELPFRLFQHLRGPGPHPPTPQNAAPSQPNLNTTAPPPSPPSTNNADPPPFTVSFDLGLGTGPINIPIGTLPGGGGGGGANPFSEVMARINALITQMYEVHEVEDPERAKRLVAALEAVPIGLVRRLQRVGAVGGDDNGQGSGDSSCAICWDDLLNSEDNAAKWNMKEGNLDTGSSSTTAHDTVPNHSHDTTSSLEPNIVSLPCAHVFHAACLVPWFSRPRQTTCPTCRFNIDPDNLTYQRPQPAGSSSADGNGQATAGQAGDQAQGEETELPDLWNLMFSGDQVGEDEVRDAANIPINNGQAAFTMLPGGNGIMAGIIPISMGAAPAPGPTMFGPAPPPSAEPGPPSGADVVSQMLAHVLGVAVGSSTPVTPQANRSPAEVLATIGQRMARNLTTQNTAPAPPTQLTGLPFPIAASVFTVPIVTSNTGDGQNESDEMPPLEPINSSVGGLRETDVMPPLEPITSTSNTEEHVAADDDEMPGLEPIATPELPTVHQGVNLPGGNATATHLPPRVNAPPPNFLTFAFDMVVDGPSQPGRDIDGQTPNNTFSPFNLGIFNPPPPRPPVQSNFFATAPTPQQPDAAPTPQPQPRPNITQFLRNAGLGPQAPGQPGQPRSRPPPRQRKTWSLPVAPGLSLRQRIERKEREARLRCFDVSCGVGPSDEEPDVQIPDAVKEQVYIRRMAGKDQPCEHTFHAPCLVSAHRVALRGAEPTIAGEDVEVACSTCRVEGIISKAQWDTGVEALA